MKTKNISDLRIIAGKWRHRKVSFPTNLNIRPTQNAVRETLFNWLQMDIVGASCLDLFAGTGACSFEALSRGAGKVTCIDKDPLIIQSLRQNVDVFSAENIELINGDCLSIIANLIDCYDIVFLDPPFNKGLLLSCFQQLVSAQRLSRDALIYFECERALKLDNIPMKLTLIKHKKHKNIQYGLVKYRF